MDREIQNLLKKEFIRQKETINLIPSENYPPQEILDVVGSILMTKYSEGYPGKRYYPGNKIYDQIEKIAQQRALRLFNLSDRKWSVNVQPYSGSPANLAVYLALLNFGDRFLGFSLESGGHLTHGAEVNFSGKFYKVKHYSIDPETEKIDYQKIYKIAKKFKPKIIVSGTTSYPRKIDFRKIGLIAKKLGIYHLADISHIVGLVVAKLHPNPFRWADIVVSTTHKTFRGPRGAIIWVKKELEKKINKAVFPGIQGGPHNNQIAGIAVMLKYASQKNFIDYQKQVVKNAKVLASELQRLGFKLFTNGTDTHLLVIDLKPLNLSGLKAQRILESANILANRNALPGDDDKFNPSGLRIGTPAVTTRGMKEKEMKIIGEWISRLLIHKEKPSKIKKEVVKLIKKFPLPYENY